MATTVTNIITVSCDRPADPDWPTRVGEVIENGTFQYGWIILGPNQLRFPERDRFRRLLSHLFDTLCETMPELPPTQTE